jgi:hypothetical protein
MSAQRAHEPGDEMDLATSQASTATSRPEPPDPFDPASLRVNANYAEGLGVKRILTTVPVRKPHKTEWFRVRPGEEWRIETTIFETEGVDRAAYLVAPDLRDEFGNSLAVVLLLLCVNRAGDPFLWRIKLPNADGRMNPWSESALRAAAVAEQRWCRLEPNMGAGCYDLYETASEWTEPKWPEVSYRDLLRIAFRDRLIDSTDHVLLRDLRGLS